MIAYSSDRDVGSVRRWCILALVSLFATCSPSLFAQDEKGCEGVGFAKQSFEQYSEENLRVRLERDPKNVDALINLGIRLEEQDQFTQADALYEKAIQANPGCYLGYLFAGLVRDRISRRTASDAQASIHKALSLNPSLQNDGNVQGFLKRQTRPMGSSSSREQERPSDTRHILASVNRFSMGLGVGILLAAIIFGFVRFARAAPRGT